MFQGLSAPGASGAKGIVFLTEPTFTFKYSLSPSVKILARFSETKWNRIERALVINFKISSHWVGRKEKENCKYLNIIKCEICYTNILYRRNDKILRYTSDVMAKGWSASLHLSPSLPSPTFYGIRYIVIAACWVNWGKFAALCHENTHINTNIQIYSCEHNHICSQYKTAYLHTYTYTIKCKHLHIQACIHPQAHIQTHKYTQNINLHNYTNINKHLYTKIHTHTHAHNKHKRKLTAQ